MSTSIRVDRQSYNRLFAIKHSLERKYKRRVSLAKVIAELLNTHDSKKED